MAEKTELWELLACDNYLIVNKSVARALKSLDAAVMLGELASEYRYYKSNNLLDEDGMFFSTVENIEKNICLSDYDQRKALQLLKDAGIIETKQKGLPAKRFFKLNPSALLNLLNLQDLQHIEN